MTAELVLSMLLGVGLASACGFRIFVPPLIMSLAARSGHLHLASNFEWMATDPALALLGVATLLEVAAYFFPVVDNLLDTVASPAAVIAGSMVAASTVTDTAPFMAWALALIAGGGAAATTQAATVTTRLASTATTAGTANPAVSAGETAASVVITIVMIVVPVLAVLALGYVVTRLVRRPATA